MSDAMERALALAQLGLHVFPCFPLGDPDTAKTPLTKQGFLDATTDPDIIRGWWMAHPEALIGVAAGMSQVVALDIDVKHDKNGWTALEAAGLVPPDTYRYKTATGGTHLIYIAPSPAPGPTQNHVLADGMRLDGIDRRSGGSYFIWWEEAWPDTRDEFQPAPEWFLNSTGASLSGEGYGGTVVEWMETVGAGEPDGLMRSAMTKIPAGDFGRAELFTRIVHLVKLAVETPGHPGAAVALHALRDQWLRAPWNAPRYVKEWNASLENAIHRHGGQATPSAPRRGRRRPLATLMKKEFKPLDWVVPGLIPEGTSLVSSGPKTGKSLAMLDVALACATGGLAFGKIAVGDPRPVLYIDLESGERRLQSRVRAQGWTDVGMFEYHLDPTDAVEEFHAFMSDNKGRRPLAIIDTLAAIMSDRPKEKTAYKHEYDSLVQFQRVTAADPGSAAIVVHHTRKQGGSDPMDKFSGTNGQTGAVDTPILLDRPDRTSPNATLVVMARDVEGGEFAMHLEGVRWMLDGATPEEARDASASRREEKDRTKLGAFAQTLIQIVEAADGPVDIQRVVSDYSRGRTPRPNPQETRDAVRKRLAELCEKGFIYRVSPGVYRAASGS